MSDDDEVIDDIPDDLTAGGESTVDGGGGGGGAGQQKGARVEVYFEEFDSWRPATVLGSDEDGLVVVQYDDGEVAPLLERQLRPAQAPWPGHGLLDDSALLGDTGDNSFGEDEVEDAADAASFLRDSADDVEDGFHDTATVGTDYDRGNQDDDGYSYDQQPDFDDTFQDSEAAGEDTYGDFDDQTTEAGAGDDGRGEGVAAEDEGDFSLAESFPGDSNARTAVRPRGGRPVGGRRPSRLPRTRLVATRRRTTKRRGNKSRQRPAAMAETKVRTKRAPAPQSPDPQASQATSGWLSNAQILAEDLMARCQVRGAIVRPLTCMVDQTPFCADPTCMCDLQANKTVIVRGWISAFRNVSALRARSKVKNISHWQFKVYTALAEAPRTRKPSGKSGKPGKTLVRARPTSVVLRHKTMVFESPLIRAAGTSESKHADADDDRLDDFGDPIQQDELSLSVRTICSWKRVRVH